MVLGRLRQRRKRKGRSLLVDFPIDVKQINPWLSSMCSKSIEAVWLQWENGDKNSGFFTAVVMEGKIEFNESFTLPVTLVNEQTGKGTDSESFKKNLLEFNLYESRKEKPTKGHHLASAMINLADYGSIEETVAVSTTLDLKKSSKSLVQPVLDIMIERIVKGSCNSSPKGGKTKAASVDLDSEIASDNDEEDAYVSDGDNAPTHNNAPTPNNAPTHNNAPTPNNAPTHNNAPTPNNAPTHNSVPTQPSKPTSYFSFENAKSMIHKRKGSSRHSKDRINVEPPTHPKAATSISDESTGAEPLKHPKSSEMQTKKTVSESGRTGLESKTDMPEDSSSGSLSPIVIEYEGTKNDFTDSKVKILEEELREAAAMEVALYSVVAEHGNSVSKVHAPARRLSRFYFHACKGRSKSERASASRASISGLILVSKACGNDVPRLTFWLSNAIVLRATISQVSEEMSEEFFENWGNMQAFIAELEKVEGWIFSRIVESVWWQALTPHMQPAAAKNSKKAYGKKYAFGDPEQVNFSIDLWKSAFKDARERLCPLRAAGLECGCLTVLARLVMEQLVNRLDVAMFNAILRDSDEDMPTDPMSDPITDANVLPVPAGKTSFGAGAQLKSCIGEWSKWLTDLFGTGEEPSEPSETKQESIAPFKPFILLNSLCDLLMLPFNMISDVPTRQEVCPNFSTALVKAVFTNFVPDEFCSDSVPESVFQALDAEVLPEADYITAVPCNAAHIVYSLPRATSLASIVEVGKASPSARRCPVLKKSYTSDDELDELDSPLKSISIDNILANPSSPDIPKKKGPKAVRYQLLREIWKDEN